MSFPFDLHSAAVSDSHIACRAHAVPLPCRAAKSLECVFPIWFRQYGRVWFTLAMPRTCHALAMPFFSRPRHSTAVERRPVGYLPAFSFFRLTRGVPRRSLSEAYQSSSQRSIPTTVKSGSSTLQKGRFVGLAVRIFPATTRTSTKDTALSEEGRGAAWHVWINARHGRGKAGERHRRGTGTACYVWIRLCSLFEDGFRNIRIRIRTQKNYQFEKSFA